MTCPNASGKTPAPHKNPSIPRRKNIPLYRNSELRYPSPIPVQGEGRSSVVTNVDRGAVDAAASGTRMRDQGEMNLVRSFCVRTNGAKSPAKPFRRSRVSCVRQNRVVLAVVATVKPCEDGSGLNRVSRHRQFAR